MTVDVRPPSTSTSVPQPHEETFPRRADPGPALVDARFLNADWSNPNRVMRGVAAVPAVGAVAFLGAAAVLGFQGWWVPGPILGGLVCVAAAAAAAALATQLPRVTGVTVTATTVQVTRTTLARADLTEVNLWTSPHGVRMLVLATPRRRLSIPQSGLTPSDWRALCRELRPTGSDAVLDLGLDVVPGGQSTKET